MGLLGRLFGDKQAPTQSSSGFAVLDLETTGLSPYDHRVVEIALVRLTATGAVIDEWATRVDPEGPVGATHIHGISQADVMGKPTFRDLAVDVSRILGGLPIVAHNATFDIAFLRGEFGRAGWDVPELPAFCTLGGSYDYLPNLGRRRLTDCCWAAGIQHDGQHSALGDARATAELFASFLAQDPALGDRIHTQGRAGWPAGPTRAPVTPEPSILVSVPVRWSKPRPKQPPLVKQLSTLSLAQVVDEGAPSGSLAYLETLMAALEDGELSAAESQQLAGLSYAYGFNEADVSSIHRAFVLALAHHALDDGHVSRDERAELHEVASMIGVSSEVVTNEIAKADLARSARLSVDLLPLPDDWTHGEPLRVGDKVAFTGCDDVQRTQLERRAENLGVRVVGSVSRLTAMLVTDGGFHGTKAAKAAELSIRIVHPDVFDMMLDHLQPSIKTAESAPRSKQDVAPAGLPHPRKEPSAPTPTASTQRGAGGADPSVVRAWAIANGIEVGTRGRLHSDVFDAYWRAQTLVDNAAR